MNYKNIKKIAVILGARPNFIKAAAFFNEAKNHTDFEFIIIHSGQHFDDNMSRIFFEEMAIPRPNIQLEMKGDFHTEKIGNMFNSLIEIFKNNKFDAVVVFGDVNTTLAGALAAIKNNLFLIHIEAGLRSHDRRMPEELNRVAVDHLSDLLFTTEPSANVNLAKEGVAEEKINYVGNIMIETLERYWNKINNSSIISDIKLTPKSYIVVTIHRQENIDDFKNLQLILEILSRVNKNIKVVFPLHPGTKKKIKDCNLDSLLDDVCVIEPLGYFDFMKLISDSQGVITDSGGIQEETTHLGVPCVTLRDNTERPVTTSQGSNKLFLLENIKLDDLSEILHHLSRDNFVKRGIPLWDDKVSQRIFKILEDKLL